MPANEECYYEYDFLMCTHRVKDGNGRIVVEMTDEQLRSTATEMLNAFTHVIELITAGVAEAAKLFGQLTETLGIDTTPYKARSFRSKSVLHAQDERAAIETQYEMARLNNPGIGMKAIQDQLIENYSGG